MSYSPLLPPYRSLPPFNYPTYPIPTTFEFTHSPFLELDSYVLTPDGALPSHLQFCPFPTTKRLPSRQRELVAHCITLVMEKIVSAEGVDIARWLSVYHLIPRLLLLSSLHKRMNINTPSACHPPTSTFRTPWDVGLEPRETSPETPLRLVLEPFSMADSLNFSLQL